MTDDSPRVPEVAQPELQMNSKSTGCDAAGRCTKVALTEDEYLDHLASLEDARSY